MFVNHFKIISFFKKINKKIINSPLNCFLYEMAFNGEAFLAFLDSLITSRSVGNAVRHVFDLLRATAVVLLWRRGEKTQQKERP